MLLELLLAAAGAGALGWVAGYRLRVQRVRDEAYSEGFTEGKQLIPQPPELAGARGEPLQELAAAAAYPAAAEAAAQVQQMCAEYDSDARLFLAGLDTAVELWRAETFAAVAEPSVAEPVAGPPAATRQIASQPRRKQSPRRAH